MSLFGSKKTKSQAANPKEEKPAASMKDLYNEAAPKKASAPAVKSVGAVNDAYRILLSPLVTEKATNLHSANKYVFVVAKGANKISIARAVASAYGVNPVKVNIMSVGGKAVSRGRVRGRQSDWRKAVVTLAKGVTIKIYEGV
jgi:large subunit ribosomal protein L23